MIEYNTLIVLAGVSLLGACAGLVGTFAVLRRRALAGDALAHAALPGLALAVILWRERDLTQMLLGALATGVLGIAVIAALRRWTRVKEDAAIGIVLSVFFGAGVVLSTLIQKAEGLGGSRAGLESFILGRTAGMSSQDVYQIGLAALGCVAVVLLLYKEFKLLSFDPGFARVQGWPVWALDFVLMGLVAVAVVIGLPAVGVVMVAALLILPGAAARFWTERLEPLLLLAVLFGVLTGAAGTLLSASAAGLPAGPIITLVGTAVFAFSALSAPRRGLLARWLAHRRFRRALEKRLLLRVLFDLAEKKLPEQPPLSLPEIQRSRAWDVATLRRLLRRAVQDGEVEVTAADRFRLTPRGWRRSLPVARDFRVWEMFLREHGDLNTLADPLAPGPAEERLPRGIYEGLVDRLRSEGRWPNEDRLPVAGAGEGD